MCQQYLAHTYRILYTEDRENRFYPATHGTMEPSLKYITLYTKSKLHKYKNIELIPCTLSDHSKISK